MAFINTSLMDLSELPAAFVYLETINQSRAALLNAYPSSVAPNAFGSMIFFFWHSHYLYLLGLFLKSVLTSRFVLVLDSTFCILLITNTNSFLGTRSLIRKKRLLTRHVHLYVCLSLVSCATLIERISVKFSIGDFYVNPSRSSYFG